MSWLSNLFSKDEQQPSEASSPPKPMATAADYCEQGQKSLDAGKYIEAMEYFQAAIEADKRFEKAYLLLATAYEKQGAIDKAKATLYGLLAIDPNNNNALQRLNRLMENSEPKEQKKASVVIESATIPKQQYIENTEQNVGGNKQLDNSKLSTKTITVDGVDFEMVFVEGGSFYYGAQSQNRYQPNYDPYADYREHVHYTKVQSFYIGKFLVTQRQWKCIMGDNPASNNKGGEYPIENVSESEINYFINRLNQKTKYKFRLPTQTEWEYAARGGKFDHGYKYPGHSELKKVAWSWSEGMETHEVGKKRPNELGLYDMLGNVSELCDGGFLRGGGDKPVIDWYLHDLDRRRSLSYIKLWRITAWTKAFLPKGNPYIGFRLAMNDWSYEGHSVIS